MIHYLIFILGICVIVCLSVWILWDSLVFLRTFIIGGIKIKCYNIEQISPEFINNIISFYPKAIEKLYIGVEKHKITEMLIESTWVFKRHFLLRRRHQKGKQIWIPWEGEKSVYNLFHLLHHMIDEIILHKVYDRRHKNSEWWKIVNEVYEQWEKEYDNPNTKF